MPAIGFLTLTERDYSDEAGVMRVAIPLYTAANFSAQETLRGNFQTALAVITNGVIDKTTFGNQVTYLGTLPTEEGVQVERKWLVRYMDATTGKKLSCEIPCADAADGYLLAQSDMADLENVDIAAFVTAFEALVVAPDTLNAVTVRSIELVGRAR